MSAVSMTIATDSLLSLPSGASYSDRSGQASVKVSRKAATSTEPERIYIYASCDSLELQCERYERTIRSLQSGYDEYQKEWQSRMSSMSHEVEELKNKPPNGIWTLFKWYLYGIISVLLFLLIVRLRRRVHNH